MSDKAWNRLFWSLLIVGPGGVLLFAWYADRHTSQIENIFNNYTWIPVLMMVVLPVFAFVIALTGIRSLTKEPVSMKTVLYALAFIAFIVTFNWANR